MTAGDIITIRESAGGRPANIYDGVDDYTLHDAHGVARVAGNDTVGTYTAWIFLGDLSGSQTILSAGDNNSVNEFLQIFTNASQLIVKLEQAGATQFQIRETTGSLKLKTWHHIAIVQNGTRPVLYVDGVASLMTDTTATDLTMWYDELANVDKFAIAVKESNATHTDDFNGAIGQIKYWNLALTAEQIRVESIASESHPTAIQTVLDAGLYFNITYENDGTTDSGLGADNGTLTGNAYYADNVSPWSYKVGKSVTGHAGEEINTVIDGNKYCSIIKRGD